ncbi:MAG: hypothetical protein ACRDKS_11955, partial [Actinomycetota bacterium]
SALLGKVHGAIARAQEIAPPATPAALAHTRVMLFLSGGRVADGIVHIASELARFSDAWDSLMHDPRAFIPVTEVTITGAGIDERLAPLLLVRKEDIEGVVPVF